MTRRRLLQYSIPIAVFIAIAALIATAPLYRVYTSEQCLDAYANARTRGDTARLDSHPYRQASNDRAKHRCGELRAVAVKDSLPLIASPTR